MFIVILHPPISCSVAACEESPDGHQSFVLFWKMFLNFRFLLYGEAPHVKTFFSKKPWSIWMGFLCVTPSSTLTFFKDNVFSCFSNQKTSPNILNWTSSNFRTFFDFFHSLMKLKQVFKNWKGLKKFNLKRFEKYFDLENN